MSGPPDRPAAGERRPALAVKAKDMGSTIIYDHRRSAREFLQSCSIMPRQRRGMMLHLVRPGSRGVAAAYVLLIVS
jgi:hypothetical protein